jgi:hypothetical protein
MGVSVDETERAELIAALHQPAAFRRGVLDLKSGCSTRSQRASVARMLRNWSTCEPACHGWCEQVATLRARITGLTVEAPQQME